MLSQMAKLELKSRSVTLLRLIIRLMKFRKAVKSLPKNVVFALKTT